MTGWEPWAVVAALGLSVLGILVYFARRAGNQQAKGAVATKQVEQVVETQKVEAKAEEVARNAPKNARSLRDWLRGDRVPRDHARKP